MSRTRLAAAIVVVFAAGFIAAADDPKSGVAVDAGKKSVSIDAKVAPRKLPHLDQIYPIEVVACWAHPKGQKAHETVVTIEAKPSEVHQALESVGLKPGKPAKGEGASAEGPEVSVFIEVPAPGGGGAGKRLSIDKFLLDPKTKKPFPKNVKFKFTGSIMRQEAPDKPAKKYAADLTGTLVAIFPVTDETVLQSSLTMKEEKYLKLEVNTEALPKEGSPVKLVIEAAGK
jgi:hypothetical protein